MHCLNIIELAKQLLCFMGFAYFFVKDVCITPEYIP